MKPWDIFRQAAGCLVLLVTFVVAMLFGYVVYWFEDRGTPFIDRTIAVRYAVDYAHDFCLRDDHPRPVNCTVGPVKVELESKDGWMMTLWYADGKRSIGMLVDRKGRTEAEDPRDVDDPRWRAPDRLPTPAEAEPRPTGPANGDRR